VDRSAFEKEAESKERRIGNLAGEQDIKLLSGWHPSGCHCWHFSVIFLCCGECCFQWSVSLLTALFKQFSCGWMKI